MIRAMADKDGYISVSEFYSSTKKNETRKSAYQYFNDKYVKTPFENYFIIEEESRFEARKLNFFLPGSIYMFGYPNPINKDILSYYDKRPMIIVIGSFFAKTTGRYILQGINLNFVPEKQKVVLLDTYQRTFNKDLREAERNSDIGLIGQAKNIAKYLKDWALMTTVFVNRGKIPLNFAVRNYDIKGVLNPVLIELEDWPMIPFFVPRELEGISPAQVYAEYAIAKRSAGTKMIDKVRSEANKKRFK
jgi:hypothetical protein